MPSPVYSTRFGVYNHSGSAVDHDLYTVPAGHVAVVRYLVFTCFASAGSASLALVGVAGLMNFASAGVGVDITRDCRLVFNAGEVIRVSFDSHEWTAQAHGFLLST